jgi:SEC-C motif-containing protein
LPNKIAYIKPCIGAAASIGCTGDCRLESSNQWLKLEVVQAKEKLDKNHAQVEFKAHFHDGQQTQIHHEVSHFVYHVDQWYFLDPTTDQQVTMKQPCICGSTKNLSNVVRNSCSF